MKVGLTAWCIGFCWGVFQGWFCEMRRHTTGWKGVRQNLSSTCEGVRLVLGSCSDRSRRWAASVAGWLLYPPHWMLTGVVDYDGIFKRVIIVIPDERKGMDGKAYGRTVTFSWTAASFFFSTAYERGSRMVSIWTWFWFYSWILMLEGTLQALLKIWSFLFQFQKLYHSFIIKERKNHVEKQQASASLEIYCVLLYCCCPS